MPKRKQAAAEAVDLTPLQDTTPRTAEPATPTAPAAERPPQEQERPRYRTVREQKEVLISPDPDAAKLRLLRSDRYKQMQISSDKEFPLSAKERLHAEGWRDRTEEEGIWTKQLPQPQPGEDDRDVSSARRRMVSDAECLFEEIANGIRATRKMPPVRLGTAAER